MYNFTYKCRNCGTRFHVWGGAEAVALTTTQTLTKDNQYKATKRYHYHECADGSIGFADFIGAVRDLPEHEKDNPS